MAREGGMGGEEIDNYWHQILLGPMDGSSTYHDRLEDSRLLLRELLAGCSRHGFKFGLIPLQTKCDRSCATTSWSSAGAALWVCSDPKSCPLSPQVRGKLGNDLGAREQKLLSVFENRLNRVLPTSSVSVRNRNCRRKVNFTKTVTRSRNS